MLYKPAQDALTSDGVPRCVSCGHAAQVHGADDSGYLTAGGPRNEGRCSVSRCPCDLYVADVTWIEPTLQTVRPGEIRVISPAAAAGVVTFEPSPRCIAVDIGPYGDCCCPLVADHPGPHWKAQPELVESWHGLALRHHPEEQR